MDTMCVSGCNLRGYPSAISLAVVGSGQVCVHGQRSMDSLK